MTHFIPLALTRYDSRGVPCPHADDRFINLEQIVDLEQHLGNNLFRRARLGRRGILLEEEHYPCVQLTMINGDKHIVSIGTYSDQLLALRALNDFMAVFTQPDSPDPELRIPEHWTT